MTQPKDTQNEAKQRVLDVQPAAHAWKSAWSETWAIEKGGGRGFEIGHGKTEAEAWQDAASKLTPTAIGPECPKHRGQQEGNCLYCFHSEPTAIPAQEATMKEFLSVCKEDCNHPYCWSQKAQENKNVPIQASPAVQTQAYSAQETKSGWMLEALEVAYKALTTAQCGEDFDADVEVVYAAIARAKGIPAPPEVKK